MAQVVVASGLGKKYRIGVKRDSYGRLSESLWNAMVSPLRRDKPKETEADFWALRDVSFVVDQGSAVGIVGRNGAGKSTLLKILSRITEPTTGRAELRGRVGALLEVGTGFHPELTGRDNIFLSGAILGMRHAEIQRRFDEIVSFADIGPFVDTPVKRYSSGMKVRLGFAVAAHLEPEILVVDEVLAVGDAAFQQKCLARMEGVSREGRTVLFVSHNMAAVQSLCTAGILLEKGQVAFLGTAVDTVQKYLETIALQPSVKLSERPDRTGDGRLRLLALDSDFRLGAPGELRIHFRAEPGLRNVTVSVGLFTPHGEGALFLGNEIVGVPMDDLPSEGSFVCRIDRAALMPGRYTANVYTAVNGLVADWITDAASIEVLEGDYFGTGRIPPPGYGSVVVPHHWRVEGTA
jgi:lipopolysaccharide transport system ATP-binding protein